MRVNLGDVHRQKILSSLPPGGRLLEWGSGASTLWFANHLPSGATLTSIQHDPMWHGLVSGEIGMQPSVRVLLRPADRPYGRRDTRDEEAPAAFHSYVHAVDGERFDVILVDGMARSACLLAARDLLEPGGIVFLHDSQRPWYDEAKRGYRAWGTIGSCADDPGPTLWFGGLTPAPAAAPDTSAGRRPLIVSFYTVDTPYEEEARELIASCDKLGLEHDVVGLQSAGSWDANCALKPEVILKAWRRHQRPILWLDADAELLVPPALVDTCAADVAIHRWDEWQLAGGTLFFNHTPLAERFLERWIERCRAEPDLIEQAELDLTWEELTAAEPLHTCWLPRAYYQIFDAAADPLLPAVIQQNQASRRLKAVVDGAATRPFCVASEAIHRARLACRPRRWFQGHPDSPDFHREVEQERRLDVLLFDGRLDRTLATPVGTRPQGWWRGTSTIEDSHLAAERTVIDICLGEVDAELREAREAILGERMAELANRLKIRVPTSFAIYGSGMVGQALLHTVRRLGLAPLCFVDSDPQRCGTTQAGLPVWSIDDTLAAGCHLYAIGSFASATAMIANLDRVYANSGFRFETMVPAGPAPFLPDLHRATKTLRLGQSCLYSGRGLADALYLT